MVTWADALLETLLATKPKKSVECSVLYESTQQCNMPMSIEIPHEEPFNLRLEALGGLSAGIIGTAVGFPLDLIKTRLQTFRYSATVTNQPPSIVQLGMTIVRQEGFWSLYKGITPSLISLSILNTLNFSSYNYIRSTWFDAQRGWDVRNAFAGAFGGPLAGSISTVELLVKTQLQVDNVSEQRFKGTWHCLSSMVREQGWNSLYTGHGTNVAREAVFLGSYFFTYEGLKFFFMDIAQVNLHVAIPISGGISGATAWFVSFPLDCIRAGIQGRPFSKGRIGAWAVARDLYQRKGISGLYSGVTPSIARAFLVSASRFSAYELALWLVHWSDSLV